MTNQEFDNMCTDKELLHYWSGYNDLLCKLHTSTQTVFNRIRDRMTELEAEMDLRQLIK